MTEKLITRSVRKYRRVETDMPKETTAIPESNDPAVIFRPMHTEGFGSYTLGRQPEGMDGDVFEKLVRSVVSSQQSVTFIEDSRGLKKARIR